MTAEPSDLSGFTMEELFRIEAENQLTTLSEGLIALETSTAPAQILGELMRAAHSLKGASRVVGVPAAVTIAHAMEDVMVESQRSGLAPGVIDTLLQGVDLLRRIALPGADESMVPPDEIELQKFRRLCANVAVNAPAPEPASSQPELPGPPPMESASAATVSRSLRVSASQLDRLIGLAGESRIALQRLRHFSRQAAGIIATQREVFESLAKSETASPRSASIADACKRLESQSALQLSELEDYDLRATILGERLYEEALACRMRPFSDCTPGLRRLVRDLAQSCGKLIKLKIVGEDTPVDREILERLESALAHLIRNAIDHGIESPSDRSASGKPGEGTITLVATRLANQLILRVRDDGAGLDVEAIRSRAIDQGRVPAETARQLAASEVIEFLFLPGFSTAAGVTEISGRGVGLDAVRATVRALRGTVQATGDLGIGSQFELHLPIALSVFRCLLIEVGDQPFALPFQAIDQVTRISRDSIDSTGGRQHCRIGQENIGLVSAAQLLALDEPATSSDLLDVIILTDGTSRFGLTVSKFLGEEELVSQSLDSELGSIRDVQGTALLPDGSAVWILDGDDLIVSIQALVASGAIRPTRAQAAPSDTAAKRVLVVDDSLTVRELERKLLTARGYIVHTAVDGLDGWNSLREGDFDLVVTDVDMPRLDGIEFVTRIRDNPRFRDLPVVIVSYQDRPADRQRGLDAGADYYLAKSSFHDDELARIVEEIIGQSSET